MNGPTPYVYFIRPIGQDGPVKIGCSIIPKGRLRTLADWSPVPLEIVATMPGDMTLEHRFHLAFRGQWMHREWFAASPALTATIDAVRSGSFDIESLPEPTGARLHDRVITDRARLRSRYRVALTKAFKPQRLPVPREAMILTDQIDDATDSELPGLCKRIEAMIARPHAYSTRRFAPMMVAGNDDASPQEAAA